MPLSSLLRPLWGAQRAVLGLCRRLRARWALEVINLLLDPYGSPHCNPWACGDVAGPVQDVHSCRDHVHAPARTAGATFARALCALSGAHSLDRVSRPFPEAFKPVALLAACFDCTYRADRRLGQVASVIAMAHHWVRRVLDGARSRELASRPAVVASQQAAAGHDPHSVVQGPFQRVPVVSPDVFLPRTPRMTWPAQRLGGHSVQAARWNKGLVNRNSRRNIW